MDVLNSLELVSHQDCSGIEFHNQVLVILTAMKIYNFVEYLLIPTLYLLKIKVITAALFFIACLSVITVTAISSDIIFLLITLKHMILKHICENLFLCKITPDNVLSHYIIDKYTKSKMRVNLDP